MNKNECLEYLKDKNIEMECINHKQIFTMAELHELKLANEEKVAKNLFLRDDKKRNYYLISIHSSKKVDLKELRTILKTRPLSFASEIDLNNILNLQKGSVTPLGGLNDKEHIVKIFIDDKFKNELIGIHPIENTATVFMNSDDLMCILKENGETCEYFSIDVTNN